jgi:FkbM family methyltransferase
MTTETLQRQQPARSRVLRSWLIDQLKHRYLGVPAAVISKNLGAIELSRKLSSLCGYVPPIVDVHIHGDRTQPAQFRMASAHGIEQVARTLWWEGWPGFERPFPDLFAAWSRESRHVLDVGAYSGFYSLIAASYPNVVKSYAFEPFADVRALLETNIRLNRMGDKIEVVAAAVSEQAGEADFYIPTTSTGLIESGSSLNPRFHEALHEKILRTIKVPMVTVDSFVEQKGCRPLDLMKIDVESQEHRVLLGARRTLREDRPVIFLEILPQADCEALELLRAELGYACGLLQPEGILWQDRVEYVCNYNNHFLCPAEKVAHFNELVAATGYSVAAPAG